MNNYAPELRSDDFYNKERAAFNIGVKSTDLSKDVIEQYEKQKKKADRVVEVNKKRKQLKNKKIYELSVLQKDELVFSFERMYLYYNKPKVIDLIATDSEIEKIRFRSIIEEIYLFKLNPKSMKKFEWEGFIDNLYYPYLSQFSEHQVKILINNIDKLPMSPKVKRNKMLRDVHTLLKHRVPIDPKILQQGTEFNIKIIRKFIKELESTLNSKYNKEKKEFGIRCGLDQLTEPNGIVQTIQEIADYYNNKKYTSMFSDPELHYQDEFDNKLYN